MSDFCGRPECALRLNVFLTSEPEEHGAIRQPCPDCLAALAAALGAPGEPRTLRELYEAVPR